MQRARDRGAGLLRVGNDIFSDAVDQRMLKALLNRPRAPLDVIVLGLARFAVAREPRGRIQQALG